MSEQTPPNEPQGEDEPQNARPQDADAQAGGPTADVPPAAAPAVGKGPELPPATTADERTWAMLAHLAALAGYVIPMGNIVGPLIVWLMKKDEMPVVDAHGKESLNFQITVTIAAMICIPLMFVCVGMILLPAVGVFALVMIIISSIKANKGESVRYPLTIRFIK